MNIGGTDTFSTAILAHLFRIIVCVGKSSTHTFTMRSACPLEQDKNPRQSDGFILSALPICHVYLVKNQPIPHISLTLPEPYNLPQG